MVHGKPIFPGNSTINQLERVLELTGRPSAPDVASIRTPHAQSMIDSIQNVRYRTLEEFFPSASPEARDLIVCICSVFFRKKSPKQKL
jgi:mitogen-activated protein kinase 15